MQCAILVLAEWKEILVMLLFRFAKKSVAHCNSEVKWEALKIFVKKFLEYTLLLDSRTVARGLSYGLDFGVLLWICSCKKCVSELLKIVFFSTLKSLLKYILM